MMILKRTKKFFLLPVMIILWSGVSFAGIAGNGLLNPIHSALKSTPLPPPTATPTECIPEWCYLERELPETVMPGEIFGVQLSPVCGIAMITGIYETLPDGWTTDEGYHIGSNTYLLPPSTNYYEVYVPDDLPPGTYTFSGSCESNNHCQVPGEFITEGDRDIVVAGNNPTYTPTPTFTPTPTASCIPEWCWLERELPETVVAGETFTVTTNLHGGSAYITQTRETIPSDWEIISPVWDEQNGDEYIWDTWIQSYEIQVPSDAEAGTHAFTGETTSYHWCNGYVDMDIAGDQTVSVVAGPSPTPTPMPPHAINQGPDILTWMVGPPNCEPRVWIFVAGETDFPGQGNHINVEIGWGESEEPDGSWQWRGGSGTTYIEDISVYDVYEGCMYSMELGEFYYTFRFSYEDGDWVYATEIFRYIIDTLPPTPSTPTMTPTIQTPTSTPTVKPPSPTPTPPPATPTPNSDTPTPKVVIRFEMPDKELASGDECACAVQVTNNTDENLQSYPFFVVLEVDGRYFFAPSFNGFDHYTVNLSDGTETIEILPAFQWPETGYSGEATWIAAFTDADYTRLKFDWSLCSFSWE